MKLLKETGRELFSYVLWLQQNFGLMPNLLHPEKPKDKTYQEQGSLL